MDSKEQEVVETNNLKSQVEAYQKEINELRAALNNERKTVSKLNEELTNERDAFRALHLQIQQKKCDDNKNKIQQIELLNKMRIKLNEYLHVNESLYNEVNDLRSRCTKLQKDKENGETMRNGNASDDWKFRTWIRKIQKETKNETVVKSSLNVQAHTLMEENQRLAKSLELADLANDELEAKCGRLKAILKAKNKECTLQNRIIKIMNTAEDIRTKKGIKCKCITYDETLSEKEAELTAMLSSVWDEELKYEHTIDILRAHKNNKDDAELEEFTKDLKKMLTMRKKTRRILALATDNMHNHLSP